MTRTLWVTNDFPPRAGGIEQFLSDLIGQLEPDGVRVLTSRWSGDAEHDERLDYPVARRRRPLLPSPATRAWVRSAIAEHKPDVVVLGAAWPLGELAANLDPPVLALTHGHEAGMARVGFGPLIRRVATDVEALGVISGFTQDALRRWIEPHTRVVRLPPGVDTNRFTPESDGGEVRARFGITEDEPLTVCVGRLVARKGQDVLVEAWPRVRERIAGARLLLVGAGPLESRLRRRVRALGLEHAVVLAGGVPASALPAVHAAADLFAMPCRTRMRGLDVEGLGIVYLEAQATGRAVLAGDSGGAPEALQPGVSGEVVDGADPDAVAAAVVRLLADPDQLAAMGRAGRGFVEQHYAWPVIVARFRGIVDDLATGSSAG